MKKKYFNVINTLRKISNFPTYAIYLVILVFILCSYYGLWNTFFIADEWHILQNQILIPDYGISYLFQLFSMPGGIHFTPIGIIFSSLQTYLFGTSIQGYAIVGIFLHYINSLIVFIIVKDFVKKRYIAFLASIFFATNSQIWEGIFWFAINIWIQASTAIILISIYLLIRFIQTKKLRIYIASLILTNLALYFLEYSFMILFVNILILLYIMLRNRFYMRNFLYAMFLSIFSMGFYVFLRIFVVAATSTQIMKTSNLLSANFIVLSLWNILTFPARIISNVLVPQPTMLAISEVISKYIYHQLPITQIDVFITILFPDQLNIFIGSIVLLILFFIFLMIDRKSTIKSYLGILGLSFLVLPIVFISIGEYRYWIFSRYLYMPYAIFSIFVFVLFAQFKLFKKYNLISLSLLIILLSYIGANMFLMNRFISFFTESGQHRKEILQYISNRLEFNKKYQIIYVTNDKKANKDAYFALPFETNTGKVIFTWSYYQSNNKLLIPRCLADPLFLSDKYNEYKYCNGKGHGYFQSFYELEKLIKNENINSEYVKAFYYDEKTGKIDDISVQIRKKLDE